MHKKELVELFRKLGAPNPESWAHSQIEENMPQLARFLFLRQAWKLVVEDGNNQWIAERRHDDPRGPGGGIVSALDRLLSSGARPDDLTTVVRVMQWRLLQEFCRLLDDPGELEKEVESIAWRLFQVDEHDSPIDPLPGLDESVLETEPNRREMRPA